MLKQFAMFAAPAVLSTLLGVAPLRADGPDEISFNLVANPKFSQCLGNDPYNQPSAKVTVGRGTANDVMIVELRNFKPGSAFDLFTIERTNLTSNGSLDPNFQNSFGLAWYQSDIHVGDDGKAEAVVKSILLDGIFGFDADPIPGSLAPPPWCPRLIPSTSDSGSTSRKTPRRAVSIRVSPLRLIPSKRPDPTP